MKDNQKIKVTTNGPYLVSGNVPLSDEKIVLNKDGLPLKWEKGKKYKVNGKYSLCRCGKSKNKPFCDGSHKGFFDTETANNIPFEKQAEVINGPELTLRDAPKFCVHAGFCDRAGGIWELTKKTDDLESKKIAIEEAGNCPSGRLVVSDKENKEIEPTFEPSISVTEDADGVPGPFWVKGGVPIESANGGDYERRNRVTLCRCGKSRNKPFCDGSHLFS